MPLGVCNKGAQVSSLLDDERDCLYRKHDTLRCCSARHRACHASRVRHRAGRALRSPVCTSARVLLKLSDVLGWGCTVQTCRVCPDLRKHSSSTEL